MRRFGDLWDEICLDATRVEDPNTPLRHMVCSEFAGTDRTTPETTSYRILMRCWRWTLAKERCARPCSCTAWKRKRLAGHARGTSMVGQCGAANHGLRKTDLLGVRRPCSTATPADETESRSAEEGRTAAACQTWTTGRAEFRD